MKRLHMNELRELIYRFRKGEGNRPIASAMNLSKYTVKKYRRLAEHQGFLDADKPLPSLEELGGVMIPPPSPKHIRSTVEPYEELVRCWLDAEVGQQTIWQRLHDDYEYRGMISIFDKRENPLILIIEPGHERIMAEVFPRRGGGIVFFDVFWQHATGRHPFHEIEGEIVEYPGDFKEWWTVGGLTVFEADDDDPNMKEWRRWLEVREDWPREMIEEIAENNGAII